MVGVGGELEVGVGVAKGEVCHHKVLLNTRIFMAVKGRKRTLFHCKWANSISCISRILY